MYNQKEENFLNELQAEEQLCVEKYQKYADAAEHTELKNLFQKLETQEQGHYNTLGKMISGTVPKIPEEKKKAQKPNYKANYTDDASYQNDKYLCADALSTEKHVSSMYNTSVFEFKQANVRNMLNHIQSDEQGHGKEIYEYMNQNGMYN